MCQGSPPPVRGKGEDLPITVVMLRITPACAGKRRRRSKNLSLNEDHPRLCGEKRSPLLIATSINGSPPPVRGKEYVLPLERSPIRITPACAGKSKKESNGGKIRRDHPRLCGEKMFAKTIIDSDAGSPPPVRGKDRGKQHK